MAACISIVGRIGELSSNMRMQRSVTKHWVGAESQKVWKLFSTSLYTTCKRSKSSLFCQELCIFSRLSSTERGILREKEMICFLKWEEKQTLNPHVYCVHIAVILYLNLSSHYGTANPTLQPQVCTLYTSHDSTTCDTHCLNPQFSRWTCMSGPDSPSSHCLPLISSLSRLSGRPPASLPPPTPVPTQMWVLHE